ncbi:MAG: ROK family transcriptional regulator [Clostridia bacterium]|nr:ROK family transcriptional regulator [Clostridia bacterium]
MRSSKERKVAMPADAKLINRHMIMDVLRRGEPVTVADIHEITGISRPTAMKTLQHYCELGVARSLGLGESTNVGGKKPELFCFCDERLILCINLWPKEICIGRCGLIGDVEGLRVFPLSDSHSLDKAFARLEETAFAYMQEEGIALDDLYGVMLSVSGTVDYDLKMLRYNSQAPEWGVNVMLGERLKAIFGSEREYFVGNAGKSTGRAILIDQPEYASRRVMTLFTTWGVSACMIERGHVLNGRDSLIGEIGHMVISDCSNITCGCGKRGCLESLVSIAHVRDMLCALGAQELCGEELTIPALFALSEAGDARVQHVVRYLTHCFAVALHNLSLAYNQEAVVIQGDYASADALFDRCLREELTQFRYYPEQEPFAIIYDKRDIAMLSLRGGAHVIKTKYFAALE